MTRKGSVRLMTFRLRELDTHDVAPEVEEVGRHVVDAAYRVHRAFGPGLIESVYARPFTRCLERLGLSVDREVWLPVEFEGEIYERSLRIDVLVAGAVIVELKSVETALPVHKAQLLSYLRLSGTPLGYLVNFNVPRMAAGIQRFANTRPRE